jgi:predicted metal-dependent phosphoesterase TrpH
LDLIGICDHNSAENVAAAQRLGATNQLTVLAGMEVTSREEAHVIALFDHARSALDLQETVYDRLIEDGEISPLSEEQIVANEFDEVEGYCPRFLFSATTLTVAEVVDLIHDLGGLAIAAHIDREHYSLIGQLGFIPPGLSLDAVEVSANTGAGRVMEKFPEIEKFPLISASDAHYLKDLGSATTSFRMDTPDIDGIRRALAVESNRRIEGER